MTNFMPFFSRCRPNSNYYESHLLHLLDTYTDFTKTTSFEGATESNASGKSRKLKVGFFTAKLTKKKYESSTTSTSKVNSKTFMVSTTMRIERYYASVKEEVSPLSASAADLLEKQDYVGFFKSCGPNYTRGIRRAQEIASIVQFQSASKNSASQWAHRTRYRTDVVMRGAKTRSGSSGNEGKSKFSEINKSIVITIVGYGLGLNQEGADTLVATSMDDQDRVMKFAFNAMTRNPDAQYIGMVYGIEIVPWAYNTSWQVAAKVGDETVEIPIPRSLMPRGYKSDGTTTWDRDERDEYICKSGDFLPDKFGYCCEIEQMVDPETDEFTGATADPETHVCRPIRALDPAVIKDNLTNNAEFVTRLDGAMRYRLAFLATFEKCISAVNAIPVSYHYNILKAQDTVKYDGLIENSVTVAELKVALDPRGDYRVMTHMGQELDEWVDMFFSPCYAALYGTHVGKTPDVEVSYFMAYPWYSHSECMKLSCLTNSMRWDRENGGCTPSLILGTDSGDYNQNGDSLCTKTIDKYDNEHCKYDQEELTAYRVQTVDDCWSELPVSQVDYLVNHFCMPEITDEVATSSEETDIDALLSDCGYPI